MILPEEPRRSAEDMAMDNIHDSRISMLLRTPVPSWLGRLLLGKNGIRRGYYTTIREYDSALKAERTELLKMKVPQELNRYIGRYIPSNV